MPRREKMARRRTLFPSATYFRYEQLDSGVFAAIDPLINGGSGGCNAGIVDLGDRTLVFDSGIVPQCGHELRNAAKKLTGRAPSYLVVSHHHNDHIRGSQAIREAVEITTALTGELIATKGKAELKEDRACAATQFAKMSRLAKSDEVQEREVGAFMVPYWRKMLASLPEVKLRLPDLTFNNKMTFYGTKRSAQLIAFENGHTESDSVLFLPHERVMFCGDLLFVRSHPFLGHGDPDRLVSILRQLKGMKASVFVPGHGPLGGRRDLESEVAYIRALSSQARRILKEGGTEDDAAGLPLPDRYVSWALGWAILEPNMRFLFRRHSEKEGS